MPKNKKYIIYITVLMCIIVFSFINKATVFDSIISVGVSIAIDENEIYYSIEYLTKEKQEVLSIQAQSLKDVKNKVKLKTGKDISFAHCVVFIIQKNQDMFAFLEDICLEKSIDYNALIFVSSTPKEFFMEETIEEESISIFIEKSRNESSSKKTLKDFLISKENKQNLILEEIAIKEKTLESIGYYSLKCY